MSIELESRYQALSERVSGLEKIKEELEKTKEDLAATNDGYSLEQQARIRADETVKELQDHTMLLERQIKGFAALRDALRALVQNDHISEQELRKMEESITRRVLEKLPSGGEVKYVSVEPKVALRKAFQEEEKNRLLEAWSKFTPAQKKIVRFLMAVGKRIGTPEMARQALGLSSTSFRNNQWARNWRTEHIEPLDATGFIRHDGSKGQVCYDLRNTVGRDLAYLEASSEDVEAIIQRVEHEISKEAE